MYSVSCFYIFTCTHKVNCLKMLELDQAYAKLDFDLKAGSSKVLMPDYSVLVTNLLRSLLSSTAFSRDLST